MRLLIVSLGNIGRRHLRNIHQIDPTAEITIWHQHTRRDDSSNDAPGEPSIVYRLEDALAAKADAALITSPAKMHVESAIALARSDVHLFIEKPLSNTLAGIEELLGLCRDRKLVLMVGYNFRFYSPMQMMREALGAGRIGKILAVRAEAGQYLPDWRPGYDYRTSVSAKRELGGGVLLELSHELDYLRWLIGDVESVSCQTGRLSDLDIDVEDTAEIVLTFECGAIGSVHLDMIQRVPTRTCRVIGSEGTLVWDGMDHSVRLYQAAAGKWCDLCPPQSMDRNEMYVNELRHFLQCISACQSPVVDGEDGRRVLEIALAADRSARTGRTVTL